MTKMTMMLAVFLLFSLLPMVAAQECAADCGCTNFCFRGHSICVDDPTFWNHLASCGPCPLAKEKLVASDGASKRYHEFGWSVAVNNGVLAIGSYDGWSGSVYVFVLDTISGSWVEVRKFSGLDMDRFGTEVAVSPSGDIIAVGAYRDWYDYGSVYLYQRTGPRSFGYLQKLQPDDDGDQKEFVFFGRSVQALDNRIYVGAPYDHGDVGAVYIFERDGDHSGTFRKVQKLVASDAARYMYFGEGVNIDITGNSLVVGTSQSYGGRAYVYVRDDASGQFQQLQKLANSFFYFGTYAAISGGLIAVVGGGAVFIYEWNAEQSLYVQVQKLLPSSGAFGRGVAMIRKEHGDVLFVSSTAAELVYEFRRNPDCDTFVETQQITVAQQDGLSGDDFGFSLAMDVAGTVMAVGAVSDYNENGTGAAYVFDLA